MTCKYCDGNWFWKKIGRCKRCIIQLTCLSVISWIIWWYAGKSNPKSIESISLIVAGASVHGLLFLHLWIRFIVLPWRHNKRKV
ncbi:DUF3624 domain-containing protein [Vibrio hepatarius]|uniref:DUF3624 domain-containing protein n=1 Tax=Vibrio hepatarius TaxID=171383 RepID=UPI001C0A27DD|nr:DUF3624 domain-containing protein [Vibrio hepatarius]MBU2896952.1 DUF3624 domain-containing protein [Vibrio hepatarius]